MNAYVGKTEDVLRMGLWLPLRIALVGLRVKISAHKAFSLVISWCRGLWVKCGHAGMRASAGAGITSVSVRRNRLGYGKG